MRTPHVKLSSRVIIWLAIRSHRWAAKTWLIVLGLAVLVVALGIVGWVQFDRQNDDISLSPLTIAFGVAAMFVFAGTNVEGLPVALEIARLLAPVDTAAAFVGLVLSFSQKNLNRSAARRVIGHVVLIGPADRVKSYVRGMAARLVVHAAPTVDDVGVEGVVRVSWTDDAEAWSAVSALAARVIVIASGSDATNAALLAAASDLQARTPLLEVSVELDDRRVALGLAAALAVQTPAHHIDVLCRADLTAELASDAILGPSERGRAVVVVGDGPTVELLLTHLTEVLRSQHQLEGASRPRLGAVIPDRERRESISRNLTDRANLDFQVFDDVAALQQWGGGPYNAFVEYAGRDATIRAALDLVVRAPGSQVCVVSSAAQLPLGIRPLELGELADDGALAGPWLRAARNDVGHERWTEMDRTAQLEHAAAIRRVVALLVSGANWEIEPRDGAWDGETTIPRSLLASLEVAETFAELPLLLQEVGYTMRRPKEPGDRIPREQVL